MKRAHNFIDLTGRVFGKLTVRSISGFRLAGKDRKKVLEWECICECGHSKVVGGNDLKRGHARSCGFISHDLKSAAKTKHGENSRRGGVSAEYRAWYAMKTRCKNPNTNSWKNYGGRGIRVCKAWDESFEAFLDYVGRKPSPDHTLDRYPDNNGDYEPGNVRWATRKEQRANQRSRQR